MGVLKKYPIIIVILILFFAIQVLPVSIDAKKAGDPLSRIILHINYYPYKALFFIESKLKDIWVDYLSVHELKDAYKDLILENSQLRAENFRMKEVELQNQRLKKLLGFIERGTYESVSANVIAGSPSLLRSEFVIIDKGKSAGIDEGMPVATEKGIVGRIYFANEKSSQVILITDPISAIDAIVHRTRARGIVKGSGTGCKLEYIEKRSDIEIGDKVISSGKDGFYPKGIVIGTIKDVSFNGGMQSATITPEVNIDALEEVIIIKNNMNEISMYEKDK